MRYLKLRQTRCEEEGLLNRNRFIRFTVRQKNRRDFWVQVANRGGLKSHLGRMLGRFPEAPPRPQRIQIVNSVETKNAGGDELAVISVKFRMTTGDGREQCEMGSGREPQQGNSGRIHIPLS
jgi:hypothetical protein